MWQKVLRSEKWYANKENSAGWAAGNCRMPDAKGAGPLAAKRDQKRRGGVVSVTTEPVVVCWL